MKKLQLPLTRLRDGESGVIISINAPPSHHHGRHRHTLRFQRRLEDMGLTPGTQVIVVKSAPFRGPLELQVRGSRLAIGRGMAEKIIVSIEK